jgi:hypothetical protein
MIEVARVVKERVRLRLTIVVSRSDWIRIRGFIFTRV